MKSFCSSVFVAVIATSTPHTYDVDGVKMRGKMLPGMHYSSAHNTGSTSNPSSTFVSPAITYITHP